MAPPPPGLLPTTTDCPSVLASESANRRAVRSALPPTAYGTQSVIGRVGYDCAKDRRAAQAPSTAAEPRRNCRRNMPDSWLIVVGGEVRARLEDGGTGRHAVALRVACSMAPLGIRSALHRLIGNAELGMKIGRILHQRRPHPEHHQIAMRFVGLEPVACAPRHGHAFIGPNPGAASVLEMKLRLALQHQEHMILDVMAVQRVFPARRIHLGM